MPSWGDLLGDGSSARQFLLWGVGQQIAGAVLLPPLTELEQKLWSAAPLRVLSPADLADMVVKGILPQDQAAGEAAQSGIDATRFGHLVDDAGNPPGTDFLLEAFRRGFIPFRGAGPTETSVEQGVLESHTKDKWLGVIQDMAVVPIPVADAVSAVLRGQIPHDQGQQAAYASGVSPSDFEVLLHTAGNPPSPSELVEFVRRGFIPLRGTGPDALTFEQGIFEGDAKDKWEPLYEKLVDYIPPPRTITTLEKAGVITPQQAHDLYKANGLTDELAAAYSANATGEKLAKNKDLAVGQVLRLYEDQFINGTDATSMLGNLGYDAQEAAFLLAITDFDRAFKALNSAVTRVGNLYIKRKIDRTTTLSALNKLNIPPKQVDQLINTWDLEAAVSVQVLPRTEIVDAWAYGIIGQDEAMTELVNLGYTPRDAWILLSVKNKGPLPNPPAQGPGPLSP